MVPRYNQCWRSIRVHHSLIRKTKFQSLIVNFFDKTRNEDDKQGKEVWCTLIDCTSSPWHVAFTPQINIAAGSVIRLNEFLPVLFEESHLLFSPLLNGHCIQFLYIHSQSDFLPPFHSLEISKDSIHKTTQGARTHRFPTEILLFVLLLLFFAPFCSWITWQDYFRWILITMDSNFHNHTLPSSLSTQINTGLNKFDFRHPGRVLNECARLARRSSRLI